MDRRVVCAAVKLNGVIVCGPRHYDATMRAQIAAMNVTAAGGEQGFVDQRGVFLTREEAWVVAEAAGQIIQRVGGDYGRRLYSENLY